VSLKHNELSVNLQRSLANKRRDAVGETTDRVNEMAGSILMIEAILTDLVAASQGRNAILDSCEEVAERLENVSEELSETDAFGLKRSWGDVCRCPTNA